MNNVVKDQAQRTKALDATQSFIVQAPAGSGKTELLTQRFLVLLAAVKNAPEEVIALTFTRKAAAEMRERIFDALNRAATQAAPDKPHALKTWQLAKCVLEKDRVLNWNLLQSPNRLRILTIDALSARLAKSAPLLSGFGTLPNIVDDATPCYREAAQSLLTSLNENKPWVPALEKLLLHLDNNYLLAENLFIGMLCRRDQWLGFIINHKHLEDARKILETGLQTIILDTLKKACSSFSDEEKIELSALASFAGRMIKNIDKKTAISHCEHLAIFPGTNIDEYSIWLGIAQLLLTNSFEWRRAVNKNCGFPSASDALDQEEACLFKNNKERMLKLLSRLKSNEDLRIVLMDILLLPPPAYSDKQWEIVKSLIELLPVLVAYLKLVFQVKNVVDYIAIAEGAIHALGDTEDPSDMALNLDYRIQHLLVDEFQDTSVTQYRLLELLTAGWLRGDGRTLFLVGDPMQSIYRFREAEVGIFLRVKKYGINNIVLHPLILEVNFRSDTAIVEWFNKTFHAKFPSYENMSLGAIPFSPSTAFNDAGSLGANVQVHSFFDPTERDEAQYIANIIKREKEINPEHSIAILVRSRNHLQTIIPELKKKNISFHAVEIEKLIYSPVVQDLFALTKAISHVGDQIAWLAILRAPWCGLELADLYQIVHFNLSSTIYENLQQYKKIKEITEAGAKRLERVVPILEKAISERSRATLRSWVAYLWYGLGGPACLEEEHEIDNAEAYFSLLDSMTQQVALDFQLLEQKLIHSYSQNSVSDSNIHLMTIHKAKGLEFDTVIIPSLERKPATDESRLLLWLERQNEMGHTDLIMAPIKSLEEDFDPIYRYIRNQNTLKSKYETTRLLYVAVTRAKKHLHLLGSLYSNRGREKKWNPPSEGSFLHLLWPSISTEFVQQLHQTTNIEEIHSEKSNFLKRLSRDWQTPIHISNTAAKEFVTLTTNHFSWSMQYAKQVGTVIHELLQRISERNLISDNNIDLGQEKVFLEKRLAQLGVSQPHRLNALVLIEKAIENVVNDKRGRWILSERHLDAKNEFPVSCHQDNEVLHYVIDRTFIDEKGIRWIIDYKTADLPDNNEDQFLIQAKINYANQLENYAKVMKLLEDRPIKLGLYFPLFSGWCEWDYDMHSDR